MVEYIDSAKGADPNPKEPPSSKALKPSSDNENEPILPHSQERRNSGDPHAQLCPQMSTFLRPTIKLHNLPTSLNLNARHSLALPNTRSTRQQVPHLPVAIDSALAPRSGHLPTNSSLCALLCPCSSTCQNLGLSFFFTIPPTLSIYGHRI